MQAADRSERQAALMRYADTCVSCGMCLPRCPTYTEARDEAESPRGRISLVRALADGRLAPSPHLLQHLDNCLVCQACESVCPAGVPYGRIIDGARALLNDTGGDRRGRSERVLSWAVAKGGRLRWLARLARVLRPFRLLVPRVGRVGRVGRSAGARLMWPRRRLAHYPARGVERGRVSLFLGCVAQSLDRRTLDDALEVLTRLGYAVDVPVDQGCCGAMDLHAGQASAATTLVNRNIAAFASAADQPVLTTASGCGAMLAQYGRLDSLTGAQAEAARALAGRVVDINAFLASSDWPADLTVAPLRRTVALHTPCSLRNVQREASAPVRLLARIPGLQVNAVADDGLCCGAAGTYMVSHPEMAQRLGSRVRRGISATGTDCVLTSNLGCALHLGTLDAAGEGALEILHPVSLLAEALRTADASSPKP